MYTQTSCLSAPAANGADTQLSLSSARVAVVDTEHMGEQFEVFADRLADEDGVTSLVSLGRRTADGDLMEPIEMSLNQCDLLIAALLAAKRTAATA